MAYMERLGMIMRVHECLGSVVALASMQILPLTTGVRGSSCHDG